MTGVPPRCLALVLCDSVARDAISGRPTIVGVFQTAELKSLPAAMEPFSAWLQVTDGNGRADMRLIVEHVPPDGPDCELSLEIPFSLDLDDPNVVREHEARFEDGIALDRDGKYRLRLTANGTTIQQRDFVATAT